MTLANRSIIAVLVGLALSFAAALVASAEVSFFTPTQADGYQNFSLLNATSTTATSTNITGGGGYAQIAGAKQVTFQFNRAWGGGNAGSSKFNVQVTPNGTDWFYWGKWVENASSTVGFTPLTPSAANVTLVGTSSAVYSMNLDYDTFLGVRCIVTETTDGEHSCSVSAEF